MEGQVNGPVTFGDIAALFGFLATAAGLWWRFEGAFAKIREDADRQIDALNERVTAAEKALADYKTEVAKDYARNGYLREVEERVLKRIDGLTQEIHGLRADINDAVKLLAAQPKRGR